MRNGTNRHGCRVLEQRTAYSLPMAPCALRRRYSKASTRGKRAGEPGGLSSVLYLLAMQQVHVNTKGQARNPVLRAYFKSKVSAGKTKIQALLCIMRRLINNLYSMMKNNTVYRMPELLATEVTDEKEQMIS